MAYSPLFFQHKKVHDRYLWVTLFSLCGFMHCLLLFLFFSCYQDRLLSFSLHINVDQKSGAPITFLFEWQPEVTTGAYSASVPTAVCSLQREATPTKKQKMPVKVHKQTEVKKMETAKKVEQKKVTTSTKSIVQPIAAQSTKADETKDGGCEEINLAVNKGQAYLSEELSVFQEALLNVWAPPEGLPQGCSCTITALVAIDGVFNRIDIVESSGMLLFDIIARNTLDAVTLPKWAYGRSITLTFS